MCMDVDVLMKENVLFLLWVYVMALALFVVVLFFLVLYISQWDSNFPATTCICKSHSAAGERCSLFEIWFILLYLSCAYTFCTLSVGILYICLEYIIAVAAAQRKWKNHICTCREHSAPEHLCHSQFECKNQRSDDCSFSFWISLYSIPSWHLDFICESSNMYAKMQVLNADHPCTFPFI